MTAIFDFDDVLHPLNEVVCEHIGINMSRLITYKFHENPILTKEEKQALLEAYNDPDIFRNIQFYDGVEQMQALQEHGIECYIDSHCFSKEIQQIKQKLIHDYIPIPDDHVNITIINSDTTISKHIFNADYFIDDRIDNIMTSSARCNIMPNKPWNTSDIECEKLTKPVIRMNQLKQIMTYLLAET